MKARLLLVAAVVLAAVVARSAPVAVAAEVSVPFRGAYVTHPETVGFDPSTGIVTLAIPAEGEATHLGRSTIYADSWVDTTSDPSTQTGAITFTAANGDQLFATSVGYARQTSVTGVVYWGEFTFTGGTGRFEGAMGSGTYWGEADGSEGTLYFDGTLNKYQ